MLEMEDFSHLGVPLLKYNTLQTFKAHSVLIYVCTISTVITIWVINTSLVIPREQPRLLPATEAVDPQPQCSSAIT